jgi:transcriptional regulator with XRE-family HTH domain
MKAGERIKAARQGRKMSVTALARASSLTKGFISQLEGGKSNPSLASLVRIASALEVPLSSLISPEATGLDLQPGSGQPAIMAARNLYQDVAGLVPLGAAQTGTHFVATVPAWHALTNRAHPHQSPNCRALALAAHGSVQIIQGGSQLPMVIGEIATFDAGALYALENENESSAVLLIFLPEGCPFPALVPIVRQIMPLNRRPAYVPVLEGPMRLAAMRAQRQKDRGR